MTDLVTAHILHRAGGVALREAVILDYAARLLRRKRLKSNTGRAFMVDLPNTVSVNDGDVFELTDGSRIAVRAAPEAVVRITGDLARLAWHIGNRHTPCQIAADHLIIARDPVLEAMLAQLGAQTQIITAAFCPEGGAYGHGRTMGHTHDATPSFGHSHGPEGFHTHSHD